MQPSYLNPYNIRRERRKLWRARLYWYAFVFVLIPSFALFAIDRSSYHMIWFWTFGGVNLLVGWIPFLTNCGRCGTPFAFQESAGGDGFTPRLRPWKWPPSKCEACGLDRSLIRPAETDA